MTGRTAARAPESSVWTTVVPWVLLALVIVLVAIIRIRLADVPLERDEGEYAYAGQLILQGVAPYTLAYNMKFPGTYYAYAAIMAVFGETATGVHLGLLVIHAATTVLVFLLARRWTDSLTGAIAAALFSTLALDRWTMAIFGHATHFVLLPALAGFVVLSAGSGKPGVRRCVLAGMLFGLAVLMKQPAAAYLLVALIWVAWRSWRRAIALAAGGVAPFLFVVLLFSIHGVLGRFWFWTFQYAAQYATTTVPFTDAISYFQLSWHEITKATGVIWLLAGIGLAALWTGRWSGETKASIALLAVASVIAIVPSFNFRQHYFILLLPVVGWLGAIACTAIGRAAARIAPAAAPIVSIAIAAAAIAIYVSGESDYLFRMTPEAISRSVYHGNPFVEAPEIARYLRERTTPADRIAVLGSEPEIYFHAGRRSATGYIYTYALMEPQAYAVRMQEELISEVERAEPKYLVRVLVESSWAVRRTSNRRIFDWLDRYVAACYDAAGDAAQFSKQVLIYQRRATGPCSSVGP